MPLRPTTDLKLLKLLLDMFSNSPTILSLQPFSNLINITTATSLLSVTNQQSNNEEVEIQFNCVQRKESGRRPDKNKHRALHYTCLIGFGKDAQDLSCAMVDHNVGADGIHHIYRVCSPHLPGSGSEGVGLKGRQHSFVLTNMLLHLCGAFH